MIAENSLKSERPANGSYSMDGKIPVASSEMEQLKNTCPPIALGFCPFKQRESHRVQS